jgi:hypothetical protein
VSQAVEEDTPRQIVRWDLEKGGKGASTCLGMDELNKGVPGLSSLRQLRP